MQLVAFRPEYQITVEPLRNRIFYKHYAEPAAATLPHYLTDWSTRSKPCSPASPFSAT